jgi:hypothetical protein
MGKELDVASAKPTPALEELVLVEQTRPTLAAAILRSLEAAFGPKAGIVLDDPSWGLAKKGARGARTFRVGTFGTIAVPRGADGGAAFARILASRLTDFEALEHARDRAARLALLYQAAHEFGAELNLDRTLEMIVQRGRALTGADICYLSLNDPERGDTYIRTTAGTRTDIFKRVRLRYGDGLGGLVAKEGRPYYSSDYLHDERFIHVVDAEVEAEGMVSVLGVPLKLGQRVIGVLFIGNRYLSSFGEEEVAFLEALGDHAAVAIENARLYGMLDRAARLHRRLTELVLTEQPIGALESEIGEVLGLRVRVLPPHGEPDVAGGVETPVRVGPTLVGRVWVETTTLDEEQQVALEQAARVVAVHLLKERAVTQAALRTRGELLDVIISGSLPAEELTRRAAEYGLDLTMAHRAVVLRGDQAAALATRLSGAFVAGRLGHTVALLAPEASVPSLDLAGVGPAAVGATGIAQSVLEATRILEVAVMLKRTGPVSRDDLGIYSLLLDPTRAREQEMQARSLLAPLLGHDEVHGRVLIPTLEAFLDAQGRPKEAAHRLRIHVNSLYYRLSRIRELSGWTLEEPEHRLQLHLACRILRLKP